MFQAQVLNATKVFAWKSTSWPISTTLTGDTYTISGEVVDNYEFQIRKQTELHINLQNKTSSDVSATRRAIRIRVSSVKNNITGETLTYSKFVTILQNWVKSVNEDIELTVGNNTLDLFAPSTIIGDLRSRIDGVTTPLFVGTKLTLVTVGATPFVESAGIVVDKAIEVDKKWEQKNVDVEAGMTDFCMRYEQLKGVSTVNVKKPQSDDDEWD